MIKDGLKGTCPTRRLAIRSALGYLTEQMLVSIRRLAGENQNDTVEQTLMGVFEVPCGSRSLAVSTRDHQPHLLQSCWWSRDFWRKGHRLPASSRAGCAFQFSTPIPSRRPAHGHARWERHGIGAQELARWMLPRHFGWRQVGDRKPVWKLQAKDGARDPNHRDGSQQGREI